MAKKPTVTTITTGYSSADTLNENFEALREGFDNTLSLDGSTPNAMEADLDLNGNNIIGAAGLLINGTDYLSDVEAAKAAALVAQAAAELAETNAETAETNAESSETAAGLSATAASTSATASAASAVDATNNGAAQVALAATQAALATTNGAAQVTLAAAQVTLATTAKTAAELAETNSETAEGNAATSATNAATSATTASTGASTASTKASEAATSATNSATSATESETAKTAAEAAKDAALAALDSFDDRYLGAKASDPTLDNDGNALVAGALYYNTTDDVMKVYEGSVWVAAYASLSGALLATNNLSDVASASAARTNLGLGTNDSPTLGGLTVDGTDTEVLITEDSEGSATLRFADTQADPGQSYAIAYDTSSNKTNFKINNTQRANFNSSGDYMVGPATTVSPFVIYNGNNDATKAGVGLRQTGYIGVARMNDHTMMLNRMGSDGLTLGIRNDGTFVGGLGNNGGELTFHSSTSAEAMRIDSSGSVGIGNTNPATALDVTGSISVSGTVDGRDVAADGTKLDGIEASADVTDTANVTAAGALMDSELTSIASVKALNQGVATTDSPTFAATTLTGVLTLPTATYHRSSDGKPRLYYYEDGDTLFRTADDFLFRNNTNTTVAQISGTGAINTLSTVTATSFIGDGSSLTGIAAGAAGGGSDEIFYENGQNVTTNYTITNGKNAMSAGPITIDSGVTVTVGAGETWTVI